MPLPTRVGGQEEDGVARGEWRRPVAGDLVAVQRRRHVPVEYHGQGVGSTAPRGGADYVRSAGVSAFRERPEELDRNLGPWPGAGRRVVLGRIDVQQRVQVRV